MDVIRATVEFARGRTPVIAGTGSNSTAEALEYSKAADEAGADALLIVTPYYNKPSQEGLFRHYAAIADSTDLPIVLYSIPSRCSVEIGVPPSSSGWRSRYPDHRAGSRRPAARVDRVDQMKQALGDDISVLSGPTTPHPRLHGPRAPRA